ncbi:hypothetical protein ACHHYP_20092 [Achlya hypogyna]|uniref:Uncharacterized protein n=1 Tax=Achlya hypogyna TaxID=1202772 RepID=A0A1V9Z745_ACHHY|nr:hypothetical protein ACHHYP_20092 [Achlya hypogyna]
MATRSAYDDGPVDRDSLRIERDVMNMLPFLEYLVDLPDVSRSVLYRQQFIDLLDEYASSRRSSPQFSNWWSWIADRDEGSRIVSYRLHEMGMVDGDGSPAAPFAWIFSAIHRTIQARGKGLVLKAPLRYHEAINYDVVMFTKYAFSNLTKRQPYYISKIEQELRFRLPNYIDSDSYIASLVQQMERHPELEISTDRQGLVFFRLRSNVHVKPPLPYTTAAAEYLNEALNCLQRDEAYPISHIIDKVRSSRLEGCAQDAYIARVIERLQRDGRLQFHEGPTFERSYFTFLRRDGGPSLLTTPAPGPPGIMAAPNMPHPGEAAIEKLTAAALKSLEKVQFFAAPYIRGEAKKMLPVNWTVDDFFAYITDGMQADLRLQYSESRTGQGQYSLASSVTVEEAAAKLTRRTLQLASIGLSLPLANIYSQAYGVAPPNWILDDYVQAILGHMCQNPVVMYNPTERCVARNPAVPVAAPVEATPASGGLKDRLPKKALSVKLAIADFSALALDLLQFVPIFAVSFLHEETKKCLPPQWTHEAYIHRVVQGMKQNPLLRLEQDEKGRAYFCRAADADTTPTHAPPTKDDEPPQKRAKKALPAITPAMAWTEPRPVAFPSDVVPRAMDLETDDTKLQAHRKALVDAGTPPSDVMDDARRQYLPPRAIPLDLVAMD